MNATLATNLVLLAQGYDDTGAASRTSIIIGALAFPCLVIIAVVWQKLKYAKENEERIEKLQRKVAGLEREQEKKLKDVAGRGEESVIPKPSMIKPLAPLSVTQAFKIVHGNYEEKLKSETKESTSKSENNACFPDLMEFQIGGYMGSSHKINHIGFGRLEYRFAKKYYEWADPIILKPDRDQWEQFWRKIDQISLWRWEATYLDSGICDGTSWSLDFAYSGKWLKSEGQNAYPGGTNGVDSPAGEFLSFLKAVQSLTGVEEIR